MDDIETPLGAGEWQLLVLDRLNGIDKRLVRVETTTKIAGAVLGVVVAGATVILAAVLGRI